MSTEGRDCAAGERSRASIVPHLRRAFILAIILLPCIFGSRVPLTIQVAFAQHGLRQGLDTAEVVLTQSNIDRFVAAEPDFAREAGGNFYHPEPKLRPTAEAIARRHGFENFDALAAVVRKIENVVDGIDETGIYVGRRRLVERQIALIDADPTRTASEKATASASLRRFLSSIKNNELPSEDIVLVTRNYDRLRGIVGEGSD